MGILRPRDSRIAKSKSWFHEVTGLESSSSSWMVSFRSWKCGESVTSSRVSDVCLKTQEEGWAPGFSWHIRS